MGITKWLTAEAVDTPTSTVGGEAEGVFRLRRGTVEEEAVEEAVLPPSPLPSVRQATLLADELGVEEGIKRPFCGKGNDVSNSKFF